MTDSDRVLSELLDQYLEAVREGERPSVKTLVREYPELEGRLRELIATVEALEAGREPSRTGGPSQSAVGPPLAGQTARRNPYLNRTRIKNFDEFFGRKMELARVFSRIAADRPQSVAIVGERRIGKSSLLNALTWPQMWRDFSIDPGGRLVFVAIDFAQVPDFSQEDLLAYFSERIAKELQVEVPEGSNSYRRFQHLLQLMQDHGQRVVLLFDEFEKVTTNPAFGPDFFSFLRSCANAFPLGYVTSSRQELQALCHSSAIADSPFFNIFSNVYLRSFSEEEALGLIAEPSRRAAVDLTPFSDPILEIAGRFPFYLQIACSAYFEALCGGCPDPSKSEMEQVFLEEALPHFSYFWDHCRAEKRHVLRQLARGEQPAAEHDLWCRQLERSGYVEKSSRGGYQLLSKTFSEQVRILDTISGAQDGGSALMNSKEGLKAGDVVNQYKILNTAGAGGMGVVYAAEDSSLKRKVAVKICRYEDDAGSLSRQRALLEAQTAASLEHPGIIKVFELFELQGMPVIVMEWISGLTLAEALVGLPGQRLPAFTSWMIQTCEALEYAHARGVIHRDLKPSNIMVTSDGAIKITDFGLAKREMKEAATTLTGTGVIVGSIHYMSPEQVRGDVLDPRSDLFSLGILMFEALTGQLPFRRTNVAATIDAILNAPTPSFNLFPVPEGRELEPIVQKLLQKRLEDRFQTAGEVKAQLVRFARGQEGVWGRLGRIVRGLRN